MPALRDDIDLVIVRENTEDLYTGDEFDIDENISVALRKISSQASKRIAKYACLIAEQRNQEKKVTCVHKSNVMRKTDGLFVRSFDVIVTTNLFGDILSDEAAQVVGGLGMAPAANIGDNFALFEPVHGAAF